MQRFRVEKLSLDSLRKRCSQALVNREKGGGPSGA